MTVPGTADVAIIGAGVIGASIAYHLAANGVSNVLLLERDTICSGTSGQSGAIIRQHYSNDFTAALARDSLTVYREWADRIGGDCGFVPTGVLFTAGVTTEAGIRRNTEMHHKLGIVSELLDRRQLAELEPRLDVTNLTAAAWEPTAGVADPVLTTSSFVRAARNLGVQVAEGVHVDAILHAHGRVTGLQTSAGPVSAGVVVNAGNIWGSRLLAPLGIDLGLWASRHPMPALRRPADFGHMHPVVLDLETEGYLIPRGNLSLAGSLGTLPNDVRVDPDAYERGVNEREITIRRRTAESLMPIMRSAIVQGGWAGIYDESPDAHPILDEAMGYAGLFLALGFSGHGFKLAPEFGRLIANRIVSGADAAPELRPFRQSRFAEGQPIGSAYGSSVIS